MCRSCQKPLRPAVIVPRSSLGMRVVVVKCVSGCISAATLGGITYPLASGDWYRVSEKDVVNWISMGMAFEFEDLNDAIYIKDKYNL